MKTRKRRRERGARPVWLRLLRALGLGAAAELGLCALAAALLSGGLLPPALLEAAAALAAFAGAWIAAHLAAAGAEKLRFPLGLALGAGLAALNLLLGLWLGGGEPGALVPAALALGTVLGAFLAARRGRGRAGLHKPKRVGTRYSG